MSFRTIEWRDNKVVMIDQTRLPSEEVYNVYGDFKEVAEAIRGMVIRGAPAIGVAAAMGIALGARDIVADTFASFFQQLANVCDIMAKTSPTAVNLFWAIDRMKRVAEANRDKGLEEIRTILKEEAIRVETEDLAICMAIGHHGSTLVEDGAAILTHCNAGGLATAGYGTALGRDPRRPRRGQEYPGLRRRDPPLAAGRAPDRLGAAEGRYPRDPDRRQHGRLADERAGDRDLRGRR